MVNNLGSLPILGNGRNGHQSMNIDLYPWHVFFWGAQSFPSWRNTIKHCRLSRVDVCIIHECRIYDFMTSKEFFFIFFLRRIRSVFIFPKKNSAWFCQTHSLNTAKCQHALMALDLLNKRMSTEETGAGTPHKREVCHGHVSYFTRNLMVIPLYMCHGQKLHYTHMAGWSYTHDVWIPIMGWIPIIIGCITIPYIPMNGICGFDRRTPFNCPQKQAHFPDFCSHERKCLCIQLESKEITIFAAVFQFW